MTTGRSGTGLPSNIAAALAYVFGPFSGVVLLMIEKNDGFVRFHAWQSTLTFLGAALLSLLVRSFPIFGGVLNLALTAGLIALWVLLIVKAFAGERFKLPYVGEIADQQIR